MMGDSRRLQAPAEKRLNALVPLTCFVFPAADHVVAKVSTVVPQPRGHEAPSKVSNAEMPAEKNSVGGRVKSEAKRR